jgi:hypothetical protein
MVTEKGVAAAGLAVVPRGESMGNPLICSYAKHPLDGTTGGTYLAKGVMDYRVLLRVGVRRRRGRWTETKG